MLPFMTEAPPPPPYFTSLWNSAMDFLCSDSALDMKAQVALELFLMSVGTAIVVGGLAKLLVPGKSRQGTWGTLILGLCGCLAASLTMRFVLVNLLGRQMYSPFSLLEILASVIFASIILAIYRSTVGNYEIMIIKDDEKKR